MKQGRAAREPAYRTVEAMDGCEILVGKAIAGRQHIVYAPAPEPVR